MDFATPIIDIVSRVMSCSKKHVDYLRGLEENLTQLRQKMEELNEIKSDVNNRVIAAERRLMVRTRQVNGWMERVEAKRIEVEGILQEGRQHLENRCLNGCCPKNCWSSYKLGKKVVKKLTLLEEVKRDGVFEIVAENPPLAVAQELPEATPVVGLDSVFDRAWNLLGENSVRIMGLYGMGGVGKTTLLTKINNEFSKRASDFDIVIWVVISKEVNMVRVREEIGKKLGLPSTADVNDIFNVLKTKKFLLLLDDIWERIDLLRIGVPSPSSENKSKIVFTTRSEEVCGQMEANKKIKVECLDWEASWALFKEKVGYADLRSDSDVTELAETVAKECRGLPLALITIGRSMASKTTCHEWEHAITVLQNSTAEFPGMGDDVLPLLKFSYDSLPNDRVRLCFLFCSLYPEDYSIFEEELIEQWIGEGYIGGYDNWKAALNTGYDVIGILKGACLLEEEEYSGQVKMHDVIRDLALWIACECGRKKDKYFVKAGVGLIERKWPTMAEKVSLFRNNITKLENIPNCPNLSTLLVSHNRNLKHIHNDFFLSMPALRFLDLSWNDLREFPTSICQLFELEFLDLSYTGFTSLPYEMRNLTKLKYLFLYGKIPRGIIMNLLNLEVLKLNILKPDDPEGRFEIDELGCLKQLKSLEISISSDSKDVEKFRFYPHLVNCALSLRIDTCNDITSLALSASSSSSSSDVCLGHLNGLRYLTIWNCLGIKELKLNSNNKESGGVFESLETMTLNGVPKLSISWDTRNLSCTHFRKLHSVRLDGCHTMVDMTWLLLIPKLRDVLIGGCDSLQEVITLSSDESGGAYPCDGNIFSNLQRLTLIGLPNLQSICNMSALPFPSLKIIEVSGCPMLRRLPLDENSAKDTFEAIKGEQEWWDRIEWKNETVKSRFPFKLWYE